MEPKELAYADWKAGMKYKDIAEKYNVSLSAVKQWATRDWKQREAVTKKEKKLQSKNVTKVTKVTTPKQPCSTPDPLDKRLAEAVEENEELTEKQKLFCYCYMKNFNAAQAARNAGYSNDTAGQIGYQLLQKTSIKNEIAELKRIKNDYLGGLCGADVIELHMRIAFADMTDFVSFKGKTVPVVYKGETVTMENPKTGERIPVTQTINVVKLKDSNQVDGQLISEVSEGRDGVKIKRVDQQRSMAFLERYFELNPTDQHRKEYDKRRLELEHRKLAIAEGKNDVDGDVTIIDDIGDRDE